MPVKKKRKDRHIHKHIYAYLFSNRQFVEYLLESFVNKEFYQQLDFSKFKSSLEHTYISDDFQEYASDMVIRVGWKQNVEIIIYLLMEFQSSPDKFMPLRVLNYLSLFYLNYIEEQKQQKKSLTKLPPVLPIIIYNGDKAWNIPNQINDLIEPCKFIDHYTPYFQYFPIIINQYKKRNLVKIRNAVSALFLYENLKKGELESNFNVITDIIKNEQPEVIKLFSVWFNHLLKNDRIDSKLFEEAKTISEKDAFGMLTKTLQEYRKDLIAQGIEQGIEQGVEQERITLIFRMIDHKFGFHCNELKQNLLTLLNQENAYQITDAILDAETIQDFQAFLNTL